jgi:putative Ca2+/H+ antiporter (TMEM165/GDT1 family)
MIGWYERTKRMHRRLHVLFQSATIILGALAPVLFLPLAQNVPELQFLGGALTVVPAVLAVMAGLASVFHWQENWVRYGYAGEALKSERSRYLALAPQRYVQDSPEGAEKEAALTHFVRQTETILMSELGDWRTQLTKPVERSGPEPLPAPGQGKPLQAGAPGPAATPAGTAG